MHGRLKGRIDLALVQLVPVDFLEEHVLADFFGAGGAGAQSVYGIAFEESAQKGLRFRTEELGHAEFGAQYLTHCLLAVFA